MSSWPYILGVVLSGLIRSSDPGTVSLSKKLGHRDAPVAAAGCLWVEPTEAVGERCCEAITDSRWARPGLVNSAFPARNRASRRFVRATTLANRMKHNRP